MTEKKLSRSEQWGGSHRVGECCKAADCRNLEVKITTNLTKRNSIQLRQQRLGAARDRRRANERSLLTKARNGRVEVNSS